MLVEFSGLHKLPLHPWISHKHIKSQKAVFGLWLGTHNIFIFMLKCQALFEVTHALGNLIV